MRRKTPSANASRVTEPCKPNQMQGLKGLEDGPGRKALQHRIATRLQVWLELAAIVPCSQNLPAPWEVSDEIERQVWELAIADRTGPGRKDRWPTVTLLATSYLSFGAEELLDKYARGHFYSLFYGVRSLLSDLIDAHQKPASESALLGAGMALAGMQTVPVCFIPSQSAVIWGGIISFHEDSNWSSFKTAIAGVELSRLRHCPVCCRIYYAIRANKGACDEHLALAAVRRARGKASTYQSNRRFRQKTGLPGVRGRQRAEMDGLYEVLGRKGKEENDE